MQIQSMLGNSVVDTRASNPKLDIYLDEYILNEAFKWYSNDLNQGAIIISIFRNVVRIK